MKLSTLDEVCFCYTFWAECLAAARKGEIIQRREAASDFAPERWIAIHPKEIVNHEPDQLRIAPPARHLPWSGPDDVPAADIELKREFSSPQLLETVGCRGLAVSGCFIPWPQMPQWSYRILGSEVDSWQPCARRVLDPNSILEAPGLSDPFDIDSLAAEVTATLGFLTTVRQGGTVQKRENDGWLDIHPSEIPTIRPGLLRDKPSPRFVPWSGPEDVPTAPVLWMRTAAAEEKLAKTYFERTIPAKPAGAARRVKAKNADGIQFSDIHAAAAGIGDLVRWGDLAIEWEYSADFRKTWHRCVKLEN